MSRRHTRRWGLLQIGHAPQPPSGPAISSVSQTAGTINGGTVLTVIGAGFAPGITSTLGTVTYVNGSEVTISTSAGSAGAFGWHVTVAGQSSSTQTYTYLAHPAFASISPSSGPQTLTTPGVVVTCSGLPPSGSGCPLTVTVDGNACTSIVLGSGSLTCTVPTDTTSGVKNVVVTVDGLTTTGTGAWTYNPPPTLLSVSEIGTIGGSCTVAGSNFFSGAAITIGQGVGAVTTTFSSSTKLTATIPAEAAGSYDVTITNPDAQSVTVPNALIITTSSTPSTIFGANLLGWWRADSLSSSPVATWTDKSGNGQSITATGSARPTWNATDTNFNNQPSVGFNGSTQYLANASFSNGGGTTPAFMFVAVHMTAAGSSPALMTCASSMRIECNGTTGDIGIHFVTFDVYQPISSVNNPTQTYGGMDSSGLLYTSTQNMTALTVSSGFTGISNNQPLSIGANVSGSGGFTTMTCAEAWIVNVKPTSTQFTQAATYLQNRYLLNNPSFAAATTIPTTGGTFRISGGGYDNGAVVVANGQGLVNQTLTTTWRSPSVLECTVPTGTYTAGTVDLQITNPDTSTINVPAGLTVTSSVNPMTIFGVNCVGWYEADAADLIFNGSNVSQATDKSLRGNHVVQATTINQPSWNSSDANFNNKPSIDFGINGTSGLGSLSCASLAANGPTAYYVLIVARVYSTTGQRYVVQTYGGALSFHLTTGTFNLLTSIGATNVTWGSPISGTNNLMTAADLTAGGTVTTDVGNASPVTGSFSVSSFSDNAQFQIGNTSISSQTQFALCCVVNAIPTSGQLSAFETLARTYGAA